LGGMKILTFTTLYPNAVRPHHGIFVEARLRQLLGSGQIEAKVMAPVPWFPFPHSSFGKYALYARAPLAELRGGIEVFHPRYAAVPRIGMSVAPFLLARSLVNKFERMLERYAFDLIDAHYFYPDGVAAVMLGSRFNKPVVITARGSDVNLIAQYQGPRRMIRWAGRQAAAVITVSRALKDSLVALGVPAAGIQVLRNGVDLELFKPVERTRTREQLGFRRKTLLSVGNLLEFKGHGIAIRALSLLPEHELIVIGDGPDRAAFDALASNSGVADRVRFTGSLGQEELRQYYGAADALLLPSSREGWPNVLLEAMACGTPVIASNVGGTPEIVTQRSAGLLIDKRSPEALAAAVKQLFSDYPDRAAIRRHAEQFGWTATTKAQLELFARILAN
jgi:glycosyltransferase involved in cell wall biosynthesis